MMSKAARWGQLHILERAIHLAPLNLLQTHWRGYPFITQRAAKGGQIEILQWALQRGIPCDETACLAAASTGQLEALKWLREHGVPWDANLAQVASLKGHSEILE